MTKSIILALGLALAFGGVSQAFADHSKIKKAVKLTALQCNSGGGDMRNGKCVDNTGKELKAVINR